MRSSRAAALLASLFLLSCTASNAEPGLGVHVTWELEEPSASIPAGVVQLVVLVYTGDDPVPADSISTVDGLRDADDNGRDEVTRADLPTGVPIRVVVRGEDAGGTLLFVGHAGPFVLEAGERRYVDLHMHPVGEFAPLDASVLNARFLTTATSLPDGRVLVSGGFTRAASGAPCPAGSPAGTLCFDLTGNSEAFVYDPTSARFYAIPGGMRQARGGHTATLLGDGRVLVAGGAARATLLLTPQTGGYVPTFVATDGGGAAATSFELFLPDANSEGDDVDRNGDPGRGGFVGAADAPSSLGRLDRPRFLHSASVIPGSPNRVLLAGGIAPEAASSWAVFDGERAGGYGVLDSATNAFAAPHAMPATVAVGPAGAESLWVLGGGDALEDADLAERYSAAGGNGNGVTVAGTMAGFPGSPNRPGLSLWRPTTYALGDGTRAIAVGWMGPACEDGMTTAVYPTDGTLTYVRCGYDAMARTYTLADTGVAIATPTRNAHAFGAGARLSDGSVVVTGGFVGFGLLPTNTIDHFLPVVPVTGVAMESDLRPLMRQARAFHAMAALEDRGVLVVGGMSLASDGASITVIAAPEILYLP